MRRKGVLAKLGWTSTRQRQQRQLRQNFAGAGLPSERAPNMPRDDLFRELLEASLLIHSSHPKACMVLLHEALKLKGGEKS